MIELGTPCLVLSPILRPPITPLYSLLSGAPWFVTPTAWSKEEGENFNTRADLKSAAMFNLKREEGRLRHVTGHRTLGKTIVTHGGNLLKSGPVHWRN